MNRILGVEEEGDGLAAEGGVRDRREVATDAYIHRLALLESRRNRRVDLLVCIFQVVHHRLIAICNPNQDPKQSEAIRSVCNCYALALEPIY